LVLAGSHLSNRISEFVLRRSADGDNPTEQGAKKKGKDKAGSKQQQQQKQQQQRTSEVRAVKAKDNQPKQQQQQQQQRSPSPPSPPSPTHITLDPHLSFYQGGYPAPLGTASQS
jgi:hypothetical protein